MAAFTARMHERLDILENKLTAKLSSFQDALLNIRNSKPADKSQVPIGNAEVVRFNKLVEDLKGLVNSCQQQMSSVRNQINNSCKDKMIENLLKDLEKRVEELRSTLNTTNSNANKQSPKIATPHNSIESASLNRSLVYQSSSPEYIRPSSTTNNLRNTTSGERSGSDSYYSDHIIKALITDYIDDKIKKYQDSRNYSSILLSNV